MHRIHRIQLLSIILLLICVSFLLGSICKYEIFVNEDTLGLKQVRLMFKRTLSQKPVLPLIHNQNKKIQHTTLETFIKKVSMQNLTRFHSGTFVLEILEIFTIIFF